jgi:hypothetical protein
MTIAFIAHLDTKEDGSAALDGDYLGLRKECVTRDFLRPNKTQRSSSGNILRRSVCPSF